jgi:hypothetical protein
MVKYYTTTDLDWLNEMNSRGIPAGNVTRQWVAVIQHPDRMEWAACIPESFLPRLGEILGNEAGAIAANLKTKEQMQADGWAV